MKKLIVIFFFLLNLSLQAKESSIYHWAPILPSFDTVAYKFEEASFHDFPRHRFASRIEKLFSIALAQDNPQLLARANYWQAWVSIRNNADAAAKSLDQAFLLSDSVKYPYDHARFLFLKGDIARMQGHWSEAYRIYKKQENFFAANKDRFYQAKVCVAIGVILQELGEKKEALKYYKKGSELFKSIECKNCLTKNDINISNMLYLLGHKDDALQILQNLRENPVVQQDTVYMINVLISLFSVSEGKELLCPKQAHQLATSIQCKQLYPLTLLTMANNMLQQQQNDSALHYLKKAFQSANDNNDVYKKTDIFRGLSDAFFRINQPDSAYHYAILAQAYNDSLLNHQKIIELNKQESRITIEQYKADLRQAQEKAAYQKRITITIIIALMLLSGLLCYILWLSKRKAQIRKQLQDAENRELALLNKQYLLELDSKNRELTSNTLIIAQKNATLKELSSQIEQLENQGAITRQESKKLKGQIKAQLLADDEWQYFKLHFEKVHPDFFTKLKDKFPNLSETELRLCAYIRIGMSTKEIAQMLSVKPETVNTSRYRIRTKIGLTSGESLEDSLRNL